MREIFKRVEQSGASHSKDCLDENEVFIEVNLDVEDIREINPWLLSIFVKYDSLDDNADGFEEFLETKEALIIALEHNDRAIFVGSRVVDGWSEFYFYSYDSKRLDVVVKQILAPSEYVYESNIVRDTKWGFYDLQLMPSELELCHIQSVKIIFLLQEEGDNLDALRVVEHYVSFQTPTQQNRFINTLDIEGFTFKDEIETDEFEHGIALVKTHAVTQEEVEKEVAMLFAQVKKENGFYEGWSTVLVE